MRTTITFAILFVSTLAHAEPHQGISCVSIGEGDPFVKLGFDYVPGAAPTRLSLSFDRAGAMVTITPGRNSELRYLPLLAGNTVVGRRVEFRGSGFEGVLSLLDNGDANYLQSGYDVTGVLELRVPGAGDVPDPSRTRFGVTCAAALSDE